MFELNYRIVHSEYDDFIGQNGFFKLSVMSVYMEKYIPKSWKRLWIKFHYMIGLKDWQGLLNT